MINIIVFVVVFVFVVVKNGMTWQNNDLACGSLGRVF